MWVSSSARSEADLLDIRNFGAKSIDEVKAKLATMGLAAQGQPARVRPEHGRRLLRRRRRPGVRERPSSTDRCSHRRNRSCPPRPRAPASAAAPRTSGCCSPNLATSLFEHGRITTTEAKAKRLRPLAERLITFAKRGDLHARRRVLTVVRDKGVVHTLFTEIGPRYENRPGGYTRITKIGPRKGDNAPMAVIELVEALTVAQEAVGEAERARGTPGSPGPAKRDGGREPPPRRRAAGCVDGGGAG